MAKKSGICKLTGNIGGYVDCHIIPKALTYSTSDYHIGSEARFVQISNSNLPKLAHSSWYDSQLVTQAGEKILSRLDSKGIKVLRKAFLVGEKRFDLGFRTVALTTQELIDLRMLFLSILWRAAESNREEFSEIRLLPDDLQLLRGSIVSETEPDLDDFPISLSQYSNLDDQFNTSPVWQEIQVVWPATKQRVLCPIFHFYMMGMSVDFSNHRRNPLLNGGWDGRVLRSSQQLVVEVQNYQTTLKTSLIEQKIQTEFQWPTELQKLVRN